MTLQQSHKWCTNRRNFQTGDIALLKDEFQHGNHWPMAQIIEAYPDVNGNVQKVKIRTGTRPNVNNRILEQPISKFSKLVLLLKTMIVKEDRFPDKETHINRDEYITREEPVVNGNI